MYPTISKICTDIPRHTKYQAVAGPPQPARPCPGATGGAGAGPDGAAPPPPLFVLFVCVSFIYWIYLHIYIYILDIFGNIFEYLLVHFLIYILVCSP